LTVRRSGALLVGWCLAAWLAGWLVVCLFVCLFVSWFIGRGSIRFMCWVTAGGCWLVIKVGWLVARLLVGLLVDPYVQ